MRIGVVFPQTELGGDAGAVRAYAQRAEELGFTHVLAYDHVVGADPAVHPGWDGPYDVHTTFHEPLVLYGYLAAVTSMELVTGVIILPQRQTVLVAKQAAEADLLTGGKFRLGVGIGWNSVEYEALGQDFSTRGKRLDEQITLLRRLWTEQSVTFSGTFDRITGAGLVELGARGHLREPAVGEPPGAAVAGRRLGADPYRDRPLHRHRRQARPGDPVEGPAERHRLLGPQPAQQGDLLLKALAPRAEVLAEGLVLDADPADAHA